MCLSCKQKMQQTALIRLQYKNGNINQFDGEGRSFYICYECLEDFNKVSRKIIKRFGIQNESDFEDTLKEILSYAKQR